MDGLAWGRWMSRLLPIVGLVAVSGCGAGKTMVMAPPEAALRAASVEILEAKSTVEVPPEAKKLFEDKLGEMLYGDGSFQRGPGLQIRYRIVQYNAGNQFARWFWGGLGNTGEGSLSIEARYFDANQKELATILTEGKIGSGVFGGSFELAIERAAEEIATYTKGHFK